AIRHSQRPIIYAGGGIIASSAAPYLKAFAERTGIPVALTLHGLGGFPSEHFLCLQMLGMHGTVYANYAINEADLLPALGLRFAEREDAILAQHAIQRLWQIVKERGQLDETIVTTGVGQHQMWAAQYWHFNSPRMWVTSGGLGAMGFGLPSAMGAQAGHPLK